MPGRIEDYAVIGNCETVALVGRDGSIDWLGLPQFDSPACFAALLGEPKHGRWLIAPADASASVSRRYSDDTLILETVFRTGSGAVRLTDFMVRRDRVADLVRIVTGLEGEVAMRMELIVRFDYGSIVPWVSMQDDGRLQLIAGPDRLLLETAVPTQGKIIGRSLTLRLEQERKKASPSPGRLRFPSRRKPRRSQRRCAT